MLVPSDLRQWADNTAAIVARMAERCGWRARVRIASSGPWYAEIATRYVILKYRGRRFTVRLADHRTGRPGVFHIDKTCTFQRLCHLRIALRAIAAGVDARRPARRRIGGAA